MNKSNVLPVLAGRIANSERCRRDWPVGCAGERAELAKRNAFIESYLTVLFDGDRHGVLLADETIRTALDETLLIELFVGSTDEDRLLAKRWATVARQAKAQAIAAAERDRQAADARRLSAQGLS